MRTVGLPKPPSRRIYGWHRWTQTIDLTIINRVLYQLSYAPASWAGEKDLNLQDIAYCFQICSPEIWCFQTGSNCRHPVLQTGALPTELQKLGGKGRTRTYEVNRRGIYSPDPLPLGSLSHHSTYFLK